MASPKYCPKCGARLRRYLRDMECPDANCPQRSVYYRGAPHHVPLWRRAWALLTLRGWRERRRKERERVKLAIAEKAFKMDYVRREEAEGVEWRFGEIIKPCTYIEQVSWPNNRPPRIKINGMEIPVNDLKVSYGKHTTFDVMTDLIPQPPPNIDDPL